ncbi:hypothetical protein [Mycobacterium sp. shizuoka-1]|uniref:hypothetical protein n=1 Tax=Mycobacterium sp. shizuoka-1 TaxID=2039281 RepID=UPI000C067CD0|nr:hypothetical protein [Mycobacterium sp. shizuoka-1]GAY19323.1 hypothetical protein MSZK_60490 [Mycobacterium sp. shizuoka-1]
MAKRTRLRIQEACDDLYCDPDDAAAAGRLRQLLGRVPTASSNGVGAHVGVVSRASWRRLVKIACDELHDDPGDDDARDRLLLLLAAGDGGLAPAVA